MNEPSKTAQLWNLKSKVSEGNSEESWIVPNAILLFNMTEI